MGVLEVVVAGQIGLGGIKRDISNGVRQRGGAKLGVGIGAGRDDKPVIRVGNTKWQLSTIE